MKVFNEYAKYYDLLYNDKDYYSEARYIEKTIKEIKPDAERILDLGCGTGKHSFYFAEKNYNVTGVELSKEMIGIAKDELLSKKNLGDNIKFINGDIRRIDLNEEFDIIISLFHVMSYQTTNQDIKSTIQTVKRHLKKDGKFIFDFWYGPAVLTQKPEARVKKLKDENVLIERFARPILRMNENIVDVNYRILIADRSGSKTDEINETHCMRYFFLPEIELFLEIFEMKAEYFSEWMTGNELSDKSWNALVIASNN